MLFRSYSALENSSLAGQLRRELNQSGLVTYGIDKSRPIFIPAGWGERRLAFTMVIDSISDGANGIGIRHEFTGYTNYVDPTFSGLVDPASQLVFNTATEYQLTRRNAGQMGFSHIGTRSIVTSQARGSNLSGSAFALQSITPYSILNAAQDTIYNKTTIDDITGGTPPVQLLTTVAPGTTIEIGRAHV